MRKLRKNFTDIEDAFIIASHVAMDNRAIARELKRETNAIHNRKRILEQKGLIKIIPRRVLFSDTEQQFLRANLWELGASECARRLKRNVMVLYPHIRRLKLPLNPKHHFNNFDVSCITNLSDPFAVYFLGFLWADGDITAEKRHRIKFKIVKDDFEVLRPHIHRLGSFWHYREYIYPKKPTWRTSSCLDIVDRGLWQFLFNHDYRVKSGASADKILAAIPESLRHYWWRGYFDGDGSVGSGRSRRFCFNSGYSQDWSFVESLGRQLAIDFTIERKMRGHRGGSKILAGNGIFLRRFYEYIYQGEQFGLVRKQVLFERQISTHTSKPQGVGTSRFRGVCICARRKGFVMQIGYKGKYVNKLFSNEIEAAQEYDRLASQFFGNAAVLNFPDVNLREAI